MFSEGTEKVHWEQMSWERQMTFPNKIFKLRLD